MFGPGTGGLGRLPRGGMRDYGGGRGRGGRQPYAIYLAMQLLYRISQLRHKPPLTLALMAGMCALHLKPDLFEDLVGGKGMFQWSWLAGGFDHVRSVCLYPASMLESYERTGDPQLRRLLISPFVHGDDVHLFSNMGSFLLKGVALELTMGTQAFAGLLAFTLLASQLLMVLAAWALLVVFEVPSPMQACTVGFSGVLFALTYVLSRRSPGVTAIMGFQINLRYAVWIELVLISVLVHNASFLGHLCGILAGMLYVEVPAVLGLVNLLTGATLFGGGRRPSYTYNSGTASSAPPAAGRGGGYGEGRAAQQPSSPYGATSDRDAAEEEAIQEALRRSMLDSAGNGGADGGGSNGSGSRDQEGASFVGSSGMSATWNGRPSGEAAAAAQILGPTPTAPPPEELERDAVTAAGGGGEMGRDELRRRRLQRLGGGT